MKILIGIIIIIFGLLFAWGVANILASDSDWLKDIDDPTLGDTKEND